MIERAWLTDAAGGRLAVPGLAEARTDGEIVAACAAAARGLVAAKGVPLLGGDPRTPADLTKRFYDFSPTVWDWSSAAVEELLEYYPGIEGDIRVDCVRPVTQDLGGGPDIFWLLGNGARDSGIDLLQGKLLSGGWSGLRDAWVLARHCLDRWLLYPLVLIVFEYLLRGRPPAVVCRRVEISPHALAHAGSAPPLSAGEARLPRCLSPQLDLFDGAKNAVAGRWMGSDKGRSRRWSLADRLFHELTCKSPPAQRVGERVFEVSLRFSGYCTMVAVDVSDNKPRWDEFHNSRYDLFRRLRELGVGVEGKTGSQRSYMDARLTGEQGNG